MHTVGHVFFGLLVGIVAKLLVPGRDAGGFLVTILIGMAGAFVGSVIGKPLGLYKEGQKEGFFVATLGAVLVLLVYRLVSG